MEAILILTALPDPAQADALARMLVDQREAACVNRIGPLHSVYRWAGRREEAEEYLLLIKTQSDRYKAVETRIRSMHPYTVPEVISIRPDQVEPRYLAWLGESLRAEPS
ncbi:Divalent ion tolerance protein, CutA1 [mine drainage metagenome]|uniref:Divalent ion tolerance protein, CutA1 n=1 Tax=mine drainage metagenome TaxID=410659 RepID=T1BUH2_9ZZZZ